MSFVVLQKSHRVNVFFYKALNNLNAQVIFTSNNTQIAHTETDSEQHPLTAHGELYHSNAYACCVG